MYPETKIVVIGCYGTTITSAAKAMALYYTRTLANFKLILRAAPSQDEPTHENIVCARIENAKVTTPKTEVVRVLDPALAKLFKATKLGSQLARIQPFLVRAAISQSSLSVSLRRGDVDRGGKFRRENFSIGIIKIIL